MVMIIEKTTGTEMALKETIEHALQLARQRKCADDNMRFVVGEPDIYLHKFAEEWEGKYRQYVGGLKHYCKEVYFVEKALTRLELWREIKISREVLHEDDIAPHVSTVIGQDLHEDLEKIMCLSKSEGCCVFGPDKTEKRRLAHTKCRILSIIHSNNEYVFAIHESFGAVVVAPAVLLAKYENFVVQFRYVCGDKI